MSCCLRVNTETLMALLVRESFYQDKVVNTEDLNELVRKFEESSPVYFMTDLDEERIYETIARYPEIFKLNEDGTISSGELIPDEEYFLIGYNEKFKEFIKRIVFHYVKGD